MGLDQINAPGAWARGATGKGALIGLVDTGVDLGHPDLRANLVPSVNLLERLDGCPRPQDTDGHGTLVAGVAVVVANNRVGLAGVAFDAKLMPIRAVSADPVFGLAEGPMAEGVRYAADHGAAVIVLAVTFPFPTDSPTGSDDDGIPAAVAYAWQKGSVVVAPAVNGDLPACGYPAVVERVVCVAASDHMGLPAKYSNLPVKPDLLGFRAPGGFGANRGVISSHTTRLTDVRGRPRRVDHLPSSRDRLRRPRLWHGWRNDGSRSTRGGSSGGVIGDGTVER